MKNPNGYGSVVKLSGNRRKPFTARKTVGWNDKGHPIYQTLGYYATREEGMIALAEFNKNPYDIHDAKMTLKEVFQKWVEIKAPKLSTSNRASLKSAFKHMKKLENMKYREIRSFHMQDCIDNCGHGYSTQSTIKNLFGHLDRFAMETDIISKMYSELTTSAPVEASHKVPFSDDEVWLLWSHVESTPYVDCVLIMLYSGWRITEFLTLTTNHVDLKAETMVGGIKTRNGKDRIVPIHSKILPLVKKRFNPANEFLIVDENGKPFRDAEFRMKFKETLESLNIHHLPHETRHTFRTRLDSAGANKKCIDLMMGHKSLDVGERVYTHKTLEELKQAIELITR